MYKACGKCGKIHSKNSKCALYFKRFQGKTNPAKERSKYAWTEKAKEIKDRAQYMCELCKKKGRYVYTNLETHHIEPITKDKSKILDDLNLVCLCAQCHKKADRGEIKKDFLKKLAAEREAGIPPT